jgi:ABC-type nitrate/sulfonate/bicarbonate transport system substrate-binding protein
LWLVVLTAAAAAYKYWPVPVEELSGDFRDAWQQAINDASATPPEMEAFVAKVPLPQQGRLRSSLIAVEKDLWPKYAEKVADRFQAALDAGGFDTPRVDEWLKKIPTSRRDAIRAKLQEIDNKHVRDPLFCKLALDSFSGYCVFRSPKFYEKLKEKHLRLELVDDEANYKKRLDTVTSGETPLALFTIDALINTVAARQTPPSAAIVLVVDETQGADAMIGYRNAVPNVAALNRKDIKVVLTPSSPSETLARVVRNQFNLPLMPMNAADYMIQAKDAKDVLKQFQAADSSEPKAFVLWEPYVSRALKNNSTAHVVVDSSRFKGYIVDVLLVNREFLEEKDHAKKVTDVVLAYLEASIDYEKLMDGMPKLVLEDAEKQGDPVTLDEAREIVKGIRWKNTRENFAHFGLLSRSEANGVQSLDEMVKGITAVLKNTNAFSRDFNPEELGQFVTKKIFADIRREQFFHDDRPIPTPPDLKLLNADQWQNLVPVANIETEKIGFLRGSAEIPEASLPELRKVAETMESWPKYYLKVVGEVRPDADPEVSEINRKLAQERAQNVAEKLKEEFKVNPSRIRVETVPANPADRTPSVSFMLLESKE